MNTFGKCSAALGLGVALNMAAYAAQLYFPGAGVGAGWLAATIYLWVVEKL